MSPYISLAIVAGCALAFSAPALAQDGAGQGGDGDDAAAQVGDGDGTGTGTVTDDGMGDGLELIEEEDAGEVIIVTGTFGDSIDKSVRDKRLSDKIVEVISAEDIGKLPDASIAESIARLPGLAAQRLDGRANVISIRGLAPDFTTTMLNGREQVSANNNRAVEFDQFPAELLSGVTVYKTPDATVTSQAVGGTVDMHIISPLTYGKQTVTVTGRGEYNTLGALNAGSTAAGYRTSVSYIDQFNDETVGVALGYARMSSPTQEERWNTWGYPDTNDDGTGDFVIGGAKPYVKSNNLVRDGLMAVIELKPKNEDFKTTFDAYYSRFDDTQLLRGIEIPLWWSGAQLQDGYTVEDGLVTSGQFNGVEAVVRNDVVNRRADTLAVGWNTQYTPNDEWTWDLDVSFSQVQRIESNMETYSGTGRGTGNGATDDLGFQMGEGGTGATFSPTLNYADPSLIRLGGPLSWGGGLVDSGAFPEPNAQDGFINRPQTDDQLAAVKLSATQKVKIPGLNNFQYGARFSQRKKALNDEGLFLTLREFPADVPIPEQFMLEPTSLDFIGMGDMVSYDAQALYDSGAYTEIKESKSAIGRSVNSWLVTENVFNSYVMTDINTKIAGMSLVGNAGVQAVYTDQSSRGFFAEQREVMLDNGETGRVINRIQVRDGDAFWDFLPSLNLNLNITDRQKLRLGLARVLARPRMDQMNASRRVEYNPALANSTDINNSPWSGGGGNPQLQPWRTWQADLSYEYYFKDGGYVAAAGYFKRISDFAFDQSVLGDFSSYANFVGGQPPMLSEGLITTPQNTGSGVLYGGELSMALPFRVINENLKGFGALFSASLTESAVKDGPDAETIDLPGLSRTVINGTVYFERAGFQVRGSVRYRSRFLGEVSGLSLARQQFFIREETLVDGQIAYELASLGLPGVSVLVQGYNLTNQPFTSYHNNDLRLVRDYQNYGRTVLMGVTIKDLNKLVMRSSKKKKKK